MKVFKAYFLIAKANFSSIIVYLAIFLGFSIFVSNINTTSEFSEVKPNVAVFDLAKNNLSSNFYNYIKDNSNIVKLKYEDVNDNLFFRKIDFVIIIKEEFKIGDKIDTKTIPGSYRSKYSEMLFNRYLNIAKAYVDNGLLIDEALKLTNEDLKYSSKVNIIEAASGDYNTIAAYYNFSNYAIISILIFIISLISKRFNADSIKKRNLVSFSGIKKINKDLLISNLLVSGIIFLVVNLVALVLFRDALLTMNGLLIVINSLVFIISISAFASLIGNLIKNKDSQTGIINVVGLGSSFISGAFVPQFLLSAQVLLIAKIFPSYYFIYNNDFVSNLTKFDFSILKNFYFNIGMMFMFAIIFTAINFIFVKKRI